MWIIDVKHYTADGDGVRKRAFAAADGRRREGERKDPFLIALGERVRALAGAPRHDAQGARAGDGGVQRHLANLEYGVGNASILVLLQVTRALHCSFAELLGDIRTQSPEWLLLREMLENRDEAALAPRRGSRSANCWERCRGEAKAASALVADRPHRPAGRGQVDPRAHAGRRTLIFRSSN